MDSKTLTIYQQSRTGEIYGSTITLAVIAIIAVILRLFARKISSASFWWDDWTIIIALILDFGLTTTYWIQVIDYGFGRHTVQAGGPVDHTTIEGFFKAFLAIQILHICSSMMFKTALILLYYRIFRIARGFRYTLIIVQFIVAGVFLASLFVAIFQCKPSSYFWDKKIPGTCINQTQFYRWNGILNAITDFMILSLPFPMVWRLNIAFRQKITLSGIFLLAMFVFVASIVRVTTFEQLNPEDVTYTNFSPGIWTVTEQSLGITCACLPTLRPLFGRVFGGSNNNGDTLNNSESPGIQLSKLSGKSTMKRSSNDESTIGFARLPEPSSSITSYATTGPKNDDEAVVPTAIMRTQLIEQHYDDMERL